MREKAWKEKNELDQLIRRTMNLGMEDGPPKLVIEYVYGFEKFGSYETWAGGYRVTDHKNKMIVERPDLDTALESWAKMQSWPKEEEEKQFSPLWTAKKNYELNHKEKA